MEEIEINGMPFIEAPGTKYLYDYRRLSKEITAGNLDERGVYRALILDRDLFFFTYFVMKIPIANHPFWVKSCKEVSRGPDTKTLDIWARDHGKSSIITISDTCCRILRNPEERIAIFSYVRPAALAFFRQIKHLFEFSDILKACFPDVLYQNPTAEALKWSEEPGTGLFVKRRGLYKEATLEAWGLSEGMPTGRHFTGRIYDDIVTQDLVRTPETMETIKQNFDLSENLGTDDGWDRVIGSFYHHNDPLIAIRDKRKEDGTPLYHLRLKPATEDGEPNGRPVFQSEKKLATLRTNPLTFATQQLLDPTPRAWQRLKPERLIEVLTTEIPKNLFKFMLIDPAGERRADKRVGDAWSIMVVGVVPYRDDTGASDIYILDLVIEPMTEAEALDNVVKVYSRNGRILKLGVEKVAMSSVEVHVGNALRAKGKHVSQEAGSLVLLRPGGRSKAQRIESNVAWPLNNGKVHLSAGIPNAYRERLKLEMEKFPFWHDDGLDTLSYCYDMLRDYRFGENAPEAKEKTDRYRLGRKRESSAKHPFLIV